MSCLCTDHVFQIEYAGGSWPKPIDKRLCVPTTSEFSANDLDVIVIMQVVEMVIN